MVIQHNPISLWAPAAAITAALPSRALWRSLRLQPLVRRRKEEIVRGFESRFLGYAD